MKNLIKENTAPASKFGWNPNTVSIVFLWIVLICWRIPFLNAGIDYTDTGFSLANYQNVFYGNGINGVGLFLTNWIGGVIYRALPAYQLLVYRIMHWLIYIAVDVCVYQIFKRYFRPQVILIVLFALSLSSKSGEALFSYYPFTKFLLLPSILLLLKGIEKGSDSLLFCSGLICGVNVFVRINNILFCCMILGIIFYGVWTKSESKKIVRNALLYFLGAIAGFFIVFVIALIYFGFEDAINSYLSYARTLLGIRSRSVENFLGIEEPADHSILHTFYTLARQGLFATLNILLLALPILVITPVCGYCFKKSEKKNLFTLIAIAVVETAIILVLRNRFQSYLSEIRVLPMLAISLYLVFTLKEDPYKRLLYLLGVLLGCVCVFGTDMGWQRMGILQGMVPLLLLLGVSDLAKTVLFAEETHPKMHFVSERFLKVGCYVIVLATLIVGLTVYLPGTYMDADFSELTETINDENLPVLRGMKTSKIRAEQLREYYELMSDEKLKDAEVAIFGYFPLGYVIGPQRDYFERVQPCVDYPGVSVVSLLSEMQKKAEEGAPAPILIVSHVNRLQRGTDKDLLEPKLAVLEYMKSLADYVPYAEENEYFTIFVPSSLL